MKAQSSTRNKQSFSTNKGNKRYTGNKPQSFAELLESSGYQIPSIRRNQEVKGKVVAVSRDELLIDIGAKSEGIVTGRELDSVRDIASKLSVGDTVDVTVLYPENDAGQVVLSLRKLSGEKRWAELEDKKDNNDDINVVALEANRGGVICDYLGIRGFLPASQLSQAPSKLTDLIGKGLTCRVIEVDRATNRLIFSQKSPDKKDLGEVLKLLAKVEIGQKLSGIVSAVLPFGIFVELNLEVPKVRKVPQVRKEINEINGDEKTSDTSSTSRTSRTSKLEGLVHVSEISWEKIEEPAKYFKVGDKADVLVIAKDESTGRLNLSIKQLGDDPFVAASAKYSKDQTVKGEVARVTPYGILINLENGVEGLMHISKIPPNITFEIGQKVECLVDSIDTRARNISLVPIVREKPILYR